MIKSKRRNGNAVIAAKDASGNILWSWHIWVCSGYNPASTAQTYYNNAGTMMDRNLGATSATPGNVGSLGLLYQWDRKDPFLGSSTDFSYTWNSTNKGMNFSSKFGSASTIWYPAAGYLYYDDASLRAVGYDGDWWSCTPDGGDAFSLSLLTNGDVYLSDFDHRALGESVRCLQE